MSQPESTARFHNLYAQVSQIFLHLTESVNAISVDNLQNYHLHSQIKETIEQFIMNESNILEKPTIQRKTLIFTVRFKSTTFLGIEAKIFPAGKHPFIIIRTKQSPRNKDLSKNIYKQVIKLKSKVVQELNSLNRKED